MFADIVIPRTRLDALTYLVPDALCSRVQVGSAVKVELRSKPVPGIVLALNETCPQFETQKAETRLNHREHGEPGISDLDSSVTSVSSVVRIPNSTFRNPHCVKPILELVESAYCPPDLLQLMGWVSRYYVASWGETLSLALPANTMGYKARKPWEMPPASVPSGHPPTLTLDQMRAVRSTLEPIRARKFKSFLLFGVTGSGKTEIYVRAADEVLRLGKSVIILVPEIALTHLLISRFEERFPGRLLALHSGLRDAERRKGWQALRDGKIRLVVGARSAVFAPVSELGLIVVDEEHDLSYKEHERQPHYNARDVAVMRAKLAGAVALLASATPSIESFFNAQREAYQLLELPKRIADRPLPKAAIISRRGRGGRDQVFSAPLVQAIKERMGTDEQVILFVGRRGFSSHLACADCGFVPRCPDCEMPLVYHADTRTLECHFCRRKTSAPDSCPECRGSDLETRGIGTQQVVAELNRMVPGARVLRLDRDVTEEPLAHQRVLDAFGRGEAKFLVGTQMVTKGFDFPNVTLCAAVSADAGLNLPDFRSAERTFQVLTQVAGRAGRGDVPGRALFQTLHPDHHALNFAARQDYRGFYEREIRFRQDLGYPPFTRLALIRIISFDPKACEQAGELIRNSLLTTHCSVMGPIPAFRKKKRNQYIYLLLVKAKSSSALNRALRSLLSTHCSLLTARHHVRIDLDIDPLEIL